MCSIDSKEKLSKSFNSEDKVFIREKWNKPLLKFLKKRVGEKLAYLGLPSPRAEDINEWIDYIKIVIAFQCREDGERSDESQDRNKIIELNTLLNKLERANVIDNYIVYDGYLEEVIIRGYDNSPTRLDFELNDFITLYNLDFCNKISSPLEFCDSKGELKKGYKFDAITKLLQIQQQLCGNSKKFVLFLTVQCSYDGKELENFIQNPPNGEVKSYIEKYNGLKGHHKNAMIVRLFFAFLIKQKYEASGFTPKVLPTLFYNGIGGVCLLHFTVLGIKSDIPAGGSTPIYQSLSEILKQKFISIEDSKFINSSVGLTDECDVELNPVILFSESKTYNSLWV